MLQQTQVKTVIPYWERWMQALPTIKALARATPEKIHKLWEGLGYYTRVRNMHQAAREIMTRHNGQFPETYDEILALPGIGRYTAGAICSIAFNQPTPILDGNVIRVLTRLFAIGENPRDKSTNHHLWQLAGQLVSQAQKGSVLSIDKSSAQGLTILRTDPFCSHLNQSLMELGALICTPKQPACPACPVRSHCAAHRRGIVDQLPNLNSQPPTTARRFVAFVCEDQGSFLVRQRPAGVVNAHLWEFPNIEISPAANEGVATARRHKKFQNLEIHPDANVVGRVPPHGVHLNKLEIDALKRAATKILGKIPASLTKLCTIKHSITRYRITLDVFKVGSSRCDDRTGASRFPHARSPKVYPRKTSLPHSTAPSPLTVPAHAWLPLKKLNRLAFPGAHRKILDHLANTDVS
jgi:A/G-specific adenine glycosylase